ncbi:unnamed protein product [Mytilus coruscus]|uniref:Fibronectin type-III domain-containing protein n=1 Tax=Mytilus coruscus TaxID=42192 RepID=A0A6J8DFZ0_MYTCO|nr:unnamed protein product [Mytilus coruscus]
MEFSYFCVIQCIVTYICIAAGKFASEVVVTVTEIQTNQVSLMIRKPGEPNQPLNLPCMLCYVQTESKEKKCVDQTDFKGHTNITILHLQPGTRYNVFVECNDVLSSNKFTFKTEIQGGSTMSSGPEVVYKESQLFSATTLDVVLGVLFGVVALCILAVTSLYLYRRHQRRRRLQNFLRTPHTDPFESLQDYVEGDTGSQFM